MAARNPTLRKLASEAGNATRYGDQQAADAARRVLAVARLRETITRIRSTAPPLTGTELATLAELLSVDTANGGAES